MNINIRYENCFNTYQISDSEALEWAKHMNIKNFRKMSKNMRMSKLQEMVDSEFNRPEYNNMHKFNRHKCDTHDSDYSYDHMDSLPDDSANGYLCRRIKEDSIVKYLKSCFKKKPHYADLLIAHFINDISIDEYARLCRRDRTTISRRCQKALKLMKNDKTYKFLHKISGLVAI